MNDGLLKLERRCAKRMARLVSISNKGAAKDRRKANELWTSREAYPGDMHKPGAAYPCKITYLSETLHVV